MAEPIGRDAAGRARVDVAPWQFDEYVLAEADGHATPEQLAVLDADRAGWRVSLQAMLHDAEEHLRNARSIPGDERDQVVADLDSEVRQLKAALARNFPEQVAVREPRERNAPPAVTGRTELQVSWEPGRVVAWAGGPHAPVGTADEVTAMLAATGAPESGWIPHAAVPLSGGVNADSCAIPVGEVLGWLVAAGAGHLGDEVGSSVRWLGQVAIWAVELTARGAMVPQLRRRTRRSPSTNAANGSYSVRWTPALVERARLERMAKNMPGSVRVLDRNVDARALTRSALTGMVDAICRDGARRIEVPAPPPRTRTSNDVAEAFLARLDGSAFDSPVKVTGEIVTGIERWARLVTEPHERLIVQLDPPDDGGAWRVAVNVPRSRGGPISVEQAIAASTSERAHLEAEMARLERMLPVLLRPGGLRRGQVILSADEAWDLMANTGPQLVAAGFEVRAPQISKRKSSPSLRVYVDAVADSAVGAKQLANVSWSAMFDEVELSAADIARLAKEARPLIRSAGRWIALDQVDLAAAADALAQRQNKEQMSGAEMLRLALGLDDSPLAGRVSIEGGGWAAELLAAADTVKTAPARAPRGFVGELRSYQAEALAWLGFLDSVGLGGCLALDMGLGKTPTMLAHLLAHKKDGPALVIAPPAVVGNWLAEAQRFAPGLRVVVHHGANRAAPDEIAAEVARADVVVTTYGTAVRDVDAIAEVAWERVVLDEAQAIKNPANDTSQQLRRIPARTRVALTGTPIENGLGDLWAILDFTNPGLVGTRPQFIARLGSVDGGATRVEAEAAMRALNGILVFRRTKAEPEIAAELPDQIDELDRCAMTPEQIGMYQALLDTLVTATDLPEGEAPRKGQILAAITALKQICNHPAAYQADDRPLAGRSGKLARLEEIVDTVFAAGEKVLVFTHFAEWGVKLADHLTERTGTPVQCYHGGLTRGVRDQIIEDFQASEGAGALVLSLKAGGTGLNLTAASHVVLYDRWWNPAVEDQARDRAWRIGQTRTVICHRLICPGTVDERVEEVVAGKRRIADLVLPKSSSLADLDSGQLRIALGIRPDAVLTEDLEGAAV
jgi:superfamily II DNA or RNA helicase